MDGFKNIQKLPIYQKGLLLVQLIDSLMGSIPDEDEVLSEIKHLMMEDVMVICAKIASAEGGNLYSIRMQNAAIIRERAMQLQVHVGSLRFYETFKNIEYVVLIRQEIEAFRLLFIEWVSNFDTSNYIWDEWEMFNPNGAIRPEQSNDSDDDFWNGLDGLDFDDKDDL